MIPMAKKILLIKVKCTDGTFQSFLQFMPTKTLKCPFWSQLAFLYSLKNGLSKKGLYKLSGRHLALNWQFICKETRHSKIRSSVGTWITFPTIPYFQTVYILTLYLIAKKLFHTVAVHVLSPAHYYFSVQHHNKVESKWTWSKQCMNKKSENKSWQRSTSNGISRFMITNQQRGGEPKYHF